MTTNAPATFPGTPEEIAANRATHHFDPESDRCTCCDRCAWGRAAEWPCGADVPRVDLDDAEADYFAARFVIYAFAKVAGRRGRDHEPPASAIESHRTLAGADGGSASVR